MRDSPAFAGDHSELEAGCRIQIRPAQLRMIDKVIGFGAELESGPLVDCELLVQSDVPILDTGLIDRVAHPALQIESSGGGLRRVSRKIARRVRCSYRSGEGSRADGGSTVQHPKLAFRSASEAAEFPDPGEIGIRSESARAAGLKLHRATHLPAS